MAVEIGIQCIRDLNHRFEGEVRVAAQNFADVGWIDADLGCELASRNVQLAHSREHCVCELDRCSLCPVLVCFTRGFKRGLNFFVDLFDRFHFGVMSFSFPVCFASKYLFFH